MILNATEQTSVCGLVVQSKSVLDSNAEMMCTWSCRVIASSLLYTIAILSAVRSYLTMVYCYINKSHSFLTFNKI